MKHRSRILAVVSAGLALAAVLAVIALVAPNTGTFDPRQAIKPKDFATMPTRPWLGADKNNICKSDPCLIIKHEENRVLVELRSFVEGGPPGNLALKSTVTLTDTGSIFSLIAKHEPEQTLDETMRQQGADPEVGALQDPQTIYEVRGRRPYAEATIELPYGVLGQWFFDAFHKVDRAMGNETDDDHLRQLANTAANEVSDRFRLDKLSQNARIAQIAFGPIQSLTYAVALIALALTAAEAFEPRLRRVADGMADLIPFTGFFGTLVGVAGGLRILGQSDVTDDVSKALALGRIGSSLGLAINTTILAIVMFGLVLVIQYSARSFWDARNPNAST